MTSSTARTRPLPYSPPASAISEMRSNISIGGSGSCGPSAKSSPRPQASRSSYSKLNAVPASALSAAAWPARFPDIWDHSGKAAPADDAPPAEGPRPIASQLRLAQGRRIMISLATILPGPRTGSPPGALMKQSRPVASAASRLLAPIRQAQAAAARTDLNGCPWHDVKAKLREVGLRPTRQRMALGWILFAKGDRHVTAEMLYEEATAPRCRSRSRPFTTRCTSSPMSGCCARSRSTARRPISTPTFRPPPLLHRG